MSSARRDRARAIGRIAEESGPLGDTDDAWKPRDTMYALARFSAHVEYDVGGRWEFEDGPRDVDIHEALAWCRQRAAKVVVQWFGPQGITHASAGEVAVAGAPSWESHAPVPRRIPGWEHLDRTADDGPISWEVITWASVAPADARLAEALTASLRASHGEDLVAVKVTPQAGPEPKGDGWIGWVADLNVGVHLRVSAPTHDDACRRAVAACTAATAGLAERFDVVNWEDNTAAYPSGSAAARNADLNRDGSTSY